MIQALIETRQAIAQAPRGITPYKVVHREGGSRLLYFAPQGQATRPPVLVSMPLINTWTIWDLLPGRSVVQGLTQGGTPVYLVDWGRFGPQDSERRFADLCDTRLGRMFSRARRHAGQELDAIGYCVGGTLLAIHLARHGGARRAAFVCTPIDFHSSGRLALWTRPENFPLDALIDGLVDFPPELMAASFATLRPMGQLQKLRSWMERHEDPDFLALFAALERWNSDNVPFPGEVYREYVRCCYVENRLITGGWMLDGEEVDLARGTVPALSIAASSDHIVEPPSAHALETVWGGPVTTDTLRGGHVAVSLKPALVARLLEWSA